MKFKAVVKTDFFQLLIMFLMSVSVAAFFLGRTSIPASEFAPFTIGAGNIIGFLLIGGISIMVAPDLWQRIFATRDEKVLRKGLAYAPVILVVLAAVISIVGLATKQFFPDIAPEDALVTGFSQLLPFGLKEFGMVLLYAVALSSSDTITFVVSSIFTRDLQNYTKRFSRASMRKLTRFFMILFVVLAILVGLVSDDVITIGLSLGSLSLALFPPIVGSFRWKLKSRAVTGSLIFSSIAVLVLALTGAMTPENTIIVLPVSAVSLFLLQKIRSRSPISRPDPRFKAIFFDADGVLIRSKFLFTEQLEKDFGIQIEKMLPFFTGVFRQCSVGKADLKEELAKVIGDWGWTGTVEELLEYWFTKGTQIDSDVVGYVKSLRDQGVRCFMATDQEKYRGEHLERELGGGKLFGKVFYSAGVGCSKKEQAFWDYAFGQIHELPDDVLFIDDDAEKVEAVSKFGLDTYLYTDLPSLKAWMNT